MRAQRVFFRSGPQSAENASNAEIVVLLKRKHDFWGPGGVSEGPLEAPGGAQGGTRDGRKTEKVRSGGTQRETTIWRDARNAPGGQRQKKVRFGGPKRYLFDACAPFLFHFFVLLVPDLPPRGSRGPFGSHLGPMLVDLGIILECVSGFLFALKGQDPQENLATALAQIPQTP